MSAARPILARDLSGGATDHPTIGRFIGQERAGWTAFAIICVLAFINYMDRMILAAVLPAVKLEFRLTDTEIGLLSAAFAATYAVAGIPLARLADTRSRRSLIALSTAIWSIATGLCGFAGSYWTLFLSRCGVGVGEAGLFPSAYSMISDYFSPARRHLVIGILYFVIALGVVVGLSLGAVLAVEFGWRGAFIILGVPGMLFAVLAYMFMREPQRGQSDEARSNEPVPNVGSAFLALLRRPLYVWLALTFGLQAFCAAGMAQWLPSFFERTSNLPLTTIGIVFGFAFGLGLGAGQFIGGWTATYLARYDIFRPIALCVWANALLCPLFLLILWLPNAMTAIVLTSITAAVAGISLPAQAAGMQNAVPSGLRGLAMGASTFLTAFLGTAVFPLLVGILSDALHDVMEEGEALRVSLSFAQVVPLLATFTSWRAFKAARAIVRG